MKRVLTDLTIEEVGDSGKWDQRESGWGGGLRGQTPETPARYL